ncbi:dual specificity protein phosphatase 22 isoform X2 [Myotis daubentonii]|uniref:dual specificity protein phosphatase 22 isoform X2 n=1 Tax=Myotis daubentonii TaxID=98922 RepID=UPI002873406C|nr:dual specificity protein phosphatase 22 isoform X2 [Myotis daubentonii]
MGNGMNKILPGLYIGNFKDARDAEQLSRNKVTHILSVHDSARPMLEGVKYLCIPAADSPSQNLTRHFKESIKFIHECRLRGEGCLVHCLAGVSRSVTLVIAYIMTVTDFGWEDALHTVRAGRSCANPNLGFQRQLQEFEKHEVHEYRQWLKEEYGESPLRDAEEARNILGDLVCGVPPHLGGQEGRLAKKVDPGSYPGPPQPCLRPFHSVFPKFLHCLEAARCPQCHLPLRPHRAF